MHLDNMQSLRDQLDAARTQQESLEGRLDSMVQAKAATEQQLLDLQALHGKLQVLPQSVRNHVMTCRAKGAISCAVRSPLDESCAGGFGLQRPPLHLPPTPRACVKIPAVRCSHAEKARLCVDGCRSRRTLCRLTMQLRAST